MCFKTPLCQVLCLMITVILYPAATAQCDFSAMEAFVTNTMEKLEQKIVAKLQVQHQEVIEKLAAHATSVQRQYSKLRNVIDDLTAGQLDIQKQLTSVRNELQQHKRGLKQENLCDNEFRTLQNSTNALHKEVIEKLIAANTTNVLQLAESNKNWRKICEKIVASQLDVGKELTNVKNESIEQSNQSSIDVIPSSCATLNINVTGTYYIRPAEDVEPFLVLCDFEDIDNLGGGWTVFQRRINGTMNFYQNWTMYKNGFGDVTGEHLLGLEKLHLMTRSGRYELFIVLEDHDGETAYALYDRFHIGSEVEKYKLVVGSFSGTAGDSLTEHNGMKFSTFDQDNDKHEKTSCAYTCTGAWWFKDCYHSHLNGMYFTKSRHYQAGVTWKAWKGWGYSLKATKMMLRRHT
uniref:Fibrinogen C-terminal domain-containing protein n=1 Tax=Anopheles atroparvus TaxID=41427 RepID=A0AAG5DJY2_ANOAO